MIRGYLGESTSEPEESERTVHQLNNDRVCPSNTRARNRCRTIPVDVEPLHSQGLAAADGVVPGGIV
eukprot:7210585-Lingulodinium_polyedra.AAC.1